MQSLLFASVALFIVFYAMLLAQAIRVNIFLGFASIFFPLILLYLVPKHWKTMRGSAISSAVALLSFYVLATFQSAA
jgi:hypothetical protein